MEQLSKKEQVNQQFQNNQKKMLLIEDEEKNTKEGDILSRINDLNMEIFMHGISLLVINDSEKAQIPLMELEISQVSL